MKAKKAKIEAEIEAEKRKRAREKAEKEEEKRKNTRVVFKEPITREYFEELAISVAKPIKRLKVAVYENFVYGYVTTASGINTWEFCLDYNDYGSITGEYWVMHYGNWDSEIPRQYAKKLKSAIKEANKNSNFDESVN